MASVQKMTTPTGAQRFAVTSDSPCPSPLSTNTVLAGRFLVGCKYIPARLPNYKFFMFTLGLSQNGEVTIQAFLGGF